MINTTYALWAIAIMTGVTVLLRALPFLVAPWLKRMPLVMQLGRFLPLAIMTLLLLDTLRGSMAGNPAGAWQELVAIAVAIVLQGRTRQPLLSISVATVLYVVFRNVPGMA